jgi:hypothetical protein
MPVVSAQPFLFTLLSPFPSLALSAEGEWAVQDLNLKSQNDHKPLTANHLTQSAKNTDKGQGTESGTLSPELVEIVRVWPGLPEAVKQQIKTLAESYQVKENSNGA